MTQQVQYVGAAGFDPSTLALTLWFKAGSSWNGSTTWSGSASAGTSGSHSGTAANGPTNGEAIAGLVPPHCDNGSYAGFTTGVASSSIVAASASSGWAVFNGIDTSAGGGGSGAEIVGDTGSYRVCVNTCAVTFVTNGGSQTVSITIPGGASVTGQKLPYHLIQWYHDGSNVWLRVDSGAWFSGSGASVTLSGNMTVSQGANALTGDIVEVAVTNVVLTRAQFDDIRDYVRETYKLAL